MTEDITPEEYDDDDFYFAEENLWYNFMQKSIELDGDDFPRGHHWFWGLHSLHESVTKFPKINLKALQNKLPDEHWLKRIKTDENGYVPDNELGKISTKSVQTDEFCDLRNYLKEVGNSGYIDFSWVKFNDDIDFSNFIFTIDIYFRETVFLKNAIFKSAIFLETADFENAKFHEFPKTHIETAKFRNATFKKTAIFNKAVFNAYANFKGVKFGGRTVFQQVKFGFHAPRFYDATFNNELILNRVELPESSKFKDDEHYETYQKTIEENKSAYETLIHLMEKQNKHHDKHRFFREEMRWRQLGNKLTQKRLKDDSRKIINAKHPISRCIGIFLTCISFCFCNKIACYFSHKKQDVDYFIWKRIENRLTITLFGLYEYLSDYGYGIGRAIFWWFLHILIGSLILFTIRYFNCFKDFTHDFGCSLGISLSNSHAFFFKGERLEKCYKAFENLPWFNFIWGVQTITGTLLIFLVLLTLRIRFRLK